MTLKIRWEDFNTGDAVLQKNYELKAIAKNVTVAINDYTKADTFSASLDYKNFPFDPRCIRSLGVTIHIENKKQTFVSNPDSPDFNGLNLIEPTRENTVFIGFADEESINFDDTSRTVDFEGRDYTALLFDAQYTGKKISLDRPLDQVLSGLLGELPATANLEVVNRTGGILPNIGSFSPDYSPLATKRSSKKKEKYWDVITDIVARAGLVAYIELDKLVVTKPRILYEDSEAYQFIYGSNLNKLTFKRKLGRQKGINVLVRSLNIETKELLTVDIPAQASAEWASALGIAAEPQKIQKVGTDGQIEEEEAPRLTFSIPNIADINQLREIGEGIWEEIGRQQIEGSFETKEMCLDQNGVEFDIIKIRNGTAVEIEILQDDLNRIKRIGDEGTRVKYLTDRCYPAVVAQAFAKTLGKFKTRFYTKQVEFTVDKDNGFSMNLDFINYIELGNKGLGTNG
jgi:hypothetical protein